MILMIDDEERRMSTFKETLEEYGYKVVFKNKIDEAYIFLTAEYKNISVVILDIMMPWGELFTPEETENGLLTGVKFLKKIREKYSNTLPFIIYTAVNNALLIKGLNKEPNCTVFYKPDSVFKIISELDKLKVFPDLKK